MESLPGRRLSATGLAPCILREVLGTDRHDLSIIALYIICLALMSSTNCGRFAGGGVGGSTLTTSVFMEAFKSLMVSQIHTYVLLTSSFSGVFYGCFPFFFFLSNPAI